MIDDDEWKGIALVMEHCWKGDFDETTAGAYRTMLGSFEAGEVMAALLLIAEGGGPFLPAVPEIVRAVRDAQEPAVPSWSEAWSLVRRALRAGCSRGGSWEERADRGRAWLVEHGHPVVGRFVEAEGFERLALEGFEDPEYGALRVRDLRLRWEEFVGVARERLARGRAIEAASGRRGEVAPAGLAAAALAESLRPARQLGEGG